MVELVYIIPFVTFNCAVQVSKHYNGENETFCVKCGLIADHFSSLGLMRTKSSIEAFYGPTAFAALAHQQQLDCLHCRLVVETPCQGFWEL